MDMLIREDFEPYLNHSFTLGLPGGGISVQLVEVKALGSPFWDGAREPFSLLFEADSGYGLLSRGSYSMSNAVFEEKTIFLVPVGHKQNRYQYEAVFN